MFAKSSPNFEIFLFWSKSKREGTEASKKMCWLTVKFSNSTYGSLIFCIPSTNAPVRVERSTFLANDFSCMNGQHLRSAVWRNESVHITHFLSRASHARYRLRVRAPAQRWIFILVYTRYYINYVSISRTRNTIFGKRNKEATLFRSIYAVINQMRGFPYTSRKITRTLLRVSTMRIKKRGPVLIPYSFSCYA